MAGKAGRSGRKRKADAIKIATGTFYHYRDGDPEAKPQAKGEPSKPTGLLPDAEEFWDQYVPLLVEMGVAKSSDGPRLQAMAEAWALLRMATKAVNQDPLDKDARISYAEYARQFANAAADFGMNPSSRSRITIDKPAKPAITGRQRA